MKFTPKEIKCKTGQTLVVREIFLEDSLAFHNFIKQIPTESNNTMMYVGGPIASEDKLRARFEADSSDLKKLNLGVFDTEGTIVGHLMFRVPHDGHPWFQHLGYFAVMVLKNYWNQGIASALLADMTEFAKSIGVEKIEATVRSVNEAGINIYKRNGFEIEGERRLSVKINGEYFNQYYIGKIL